VNVAGRGLVVVTGCGHAGAVNQLTNPAVDPTCKIPEYKVCAATVERLDVAPGSHGATGTGDAAGPRQNYTPESDPKMFPYAVGETKTPASREGKRH